MIIVVILIGAFFIDFILNRAYGKFWDSLLDAKVEFQKEPVTEGQKAFLTETITNQKWLFLPILQVGFQIHKNLWFGDGENTSVSDQCYKRDIFSVGSYQKITRKIPFRCTRRGYYEVESVELVTRSPLMTKKYYGTLKQHSSFYVYPSGIGEKELEIPFQKVMGSVLSRKNLYEDPFEFRGIREYLPTDPMSRINWKASARTDQWMVNLFDSTAAQEVLIFLDVDDETIWKYDEIHEEGIRLAASLAFLCIQRGIFVGIRTNGHDLKTKELFSREPGAGKQQIRYINEGLARLDLLQKAEPMGFLLDREREKREVSSRTYLMISKNQKENCYESFLKLLQQGAGGIWISTLYKEMELQLRQTPDCPIIRWEVRK